MKNLKIFPKMFLQTFGILGTVIVLIHLLVFFIFPRTYLETRKQELYAKADEIVFKEKIGNLSNSLWNFILKVVI